MNYIPLDLNYISLGSSMLSLAFRIICQQDSPNFSKKFCIQTGHNYVCILKILSWCKEELCESSHS